MLITKVKQNTYSPLNRLSSYMKKLLLKESLILKFCRNHVFSNFVQNIRRFHLKQIEIF